uniref:type II toxin-antitoxin system RelE/ParE family toxin n=1 Tax=Candidatus Electrothrix sp. TaxID=2170559 RepID=UPI004056415D
MENHLDSILHWSIDELCTVLLNSAYLAVIGITTSAKSSFCTCKRYLLEVPQAGAVVPGTGGVRKLRWRRAGMGKRGGLRILYYVQDIQGRIWLLTVYSKSARENITANDLKMLKEAVDNAKII